MSGKYLYFAEGACIINNTMKITIIKNTGFAWLTLFKPEVIITEHFEEAQ